MNKVQEALKAAIKAMELANISCEHFHHKKKHQHLYGEKCIPEDMWKDALELCKAALSEIEIGTSSQPFGYEVTGKLGVLCSFRAPDVKKGDMVYTSPQPREWVGLSKSEVSELFKENGITLSYSGVNKFASSISEKLKQLNTKG